ncbi:hypothetical protein D3C74_490090 [compost metagenome]
MAIIPHGTGPDMPWTCATISKAAKNSTCEMASSPRTTVNLAMYTALRETGNTSSCFHPPPVCS